MTDKSIRRLENYLKDMDKINERMHYLGRKLVGTIQMARAEFADDKVLSAELKALTEFIVKPEFIRQWVITMGALGKEGAEAKKMVAKAVQGSKS